MSRLYRVGEFAGLAGVSVRTLHHYDRLGLLRPRRNGTGYRLYGIAELERLEQIVALKFLGLPLKQIRTLLDQDTRALPEVLHAQRQALEARRRRMDQAILAIRDAECALKPGQETDAAALKKIIEVIEMQENNAEFLNRYYNEPAQAKMAVRREQWSPELQEKATKDWTELFRDVEAALDEDPAGEKAQALAVRWKKLVEAFTGGDPDITAGLKNVWANRQEWPATLKEKSQPFVNPKVWEFIGKAMRCGGGS